MRNKHEVNVEKFVRWRKQIHLIELMYNGIITFSNVIDDTFAFKDEWISHDHIKNQINPNDKDTYLYSKSVNTRYTCLAGMSSFWWRCLNLIVIFEGFYNVPSPFKFIENRFLDLIVLCKWRNMYLWKNSGFS